MSGCLSYGFATSSHNQFLAPPDSHAETQRQTRRSVVENSDGTSDGSSPRTDTCQQYQQSHVERGSEIGDGVLGKAGAQHG